jgi:hypothetical protein
VGIAKKRKCAWKLKVFVAGESRASWEQKFGFIDVTTYRQALLGAASHQDVIHVTSRDIKRLL